MSLRSHYSGTYDIRLFVSDLRNFSDTRRYRQLATLPMYLIRHIVPKDKFTSVLANLIP